MEVQNQGIKKEIVDVVFESFVDGLGTGPPSYPALSSCFFFQSLIERITLAGFPPTRVFGGTSLVTTAAAATTEFSPTVTPPMIVAPAAIHTLFSITMGFPIVAARRCEGSSGWPAVMMLTFGPIITSSAMSRPPRS